MRANFVKAQNPTTSMNLGAVRKIHKFFEDLDIEKSRYSIDDYNHVEVKGNLRLSSLDKEEWLPANMTVLGELQLQGNQIIKKLPEGLVVKGDLSLAYSKVDFIPAKTVIGGSLDLDQCSYLYSLPPDLKVGKNLWIRGTRITSIPNTISVKGIIWTDSTVKVPKDLQAKDKRPC